MTTYYVRFFDNFYNSKNIMTYDSFSNGSCLSNRGSCWHFFDANLEESGVPTNIFKTLKALSSNSLQTEVLEDIIPYDESTSPEEDNLWDIGNIFLKYRWQDDPTFRFGGYRLKDWNDVGYSTNSLDNFYPKLLQKLESIKVGSSIANWNHINVLIFKTYSNGVLPETEPELSDMISTVIFEGNDSANANIVVTL